MGFAMRNSPGCFCARSLFRGSRCSTLALRDASHEHKVNTSARISADAKPCLHVTADFSVYLTCISSAASSDIQYRQHTIIATSYYFINLLFPHHGRTTFGIVANVPRHSRRREERGDLASSTSSDVCSVLSQSCWSCSSST
jgi:hypothetical protein